MGGDALAPVNESNRSSYGPRTFHTLNESGSNNHSFGSLLDNLDTEKGCTRLDIGIGWQGCTARQQHPTALRELGARVRNFFF
jgi:hypothetical protein